jgi:hypothetical protein
MANSIDERRRCGRVRWKAIIPPIAAAPACVSASRAIELTSRGALGSLWRYVKAGLIEPDLVTAGGHFRFDPEHVRRQLRALQQRGDG